MDILLSTFESQILDTTFDKKQHTGWLSALNCVFVPGMNEVMTQTYCLLHIRMTLKITWNTAEAQMLLYQACQCRSLLGLSPRRSDTQQCYWMTWTDQEDRILMSGDWCLDNLTPGYTQSPTALDQERSLVQSRHHLVCFIRIIARYKQTS